jgi:type II secretion system protein J
VNGDLFVNRKKTGFTFIELLIAVSIFAVIAVALYSTFFAGISLWKRSSEGGNVYHDIRFMFGDMTKDFRNIVYMTGDEESMYAFSGAEDEVIFMTLEDTSAEEDVIRRELVKVAYRFDESTDELIRIRAYKSVGFNIENEKAEKELMLKGIEDFKFEYCYDSDDEFDPYLWKEEWEHDDLKPTIGVKVTFHIKAETKRKPLRFSKTIFVPTGVFEKEPVGL